MSKRAAVLVDTSVFVEFFRIRRPVEQAPHPLEALTLDSRVYLSDLVRLEVLIGLKLREQKYIQALLSALPLILTSASLTDRAVALLPLIRRSGLNVSIVDYLICLQAMENEMVLFTRDRVMAKLARLLEISLF